MAADPVAARPLPLFADAAGPTALPHAAAVGKVPCPEFGTHLLALAEVRGIGLHALRALVGAYPSLSNVWTDEPENVTDLLAKARVPGAAQIARSIHSDAGWLQNRGARERDRLERRGYLVIGSSDPAFPSRLRAIPGQPLWLFVEGDTTTLSSPPLVAVVGTRKPSKQGVNAARHLTRMVLELGLGIVSGLADGIDREAHDVAARHGGRQVAVLGTGIEVSFPAENAGLRRSIVENGGLVVSEYLPAERYGKANFVQRNRIQAALASVVCPVEAGTPSGTAHTIGFARDYGRPLFGVYRETPSPDNEVVVQFRRDGTPVFDLASGSDRGRLKNFLAQVEGERVPPLAPPTISFMVKGIEDQIRQLDSLYDLSREERQEIVNRIASKLNVPIRLEEIEHDS